MHSATLTNERVERALACVGAYQRIALHNIVVPAEKRKAALPQAREPARLPPKLRRVCERAYRWAGGMASGGSGG